MRISYDDDEVRVFHEHVKTALDEYMKQQNLCGKYECLHHENLSDVDGIPDFIIKKKDNGKWVYVIEVKRTPKDALSPEFWNQGRRYVLDNPHWNNNSAQYFMLTNIETSCFLENNSSITEQTISDALLPEGIMDTKRRFGVDDKDEETVSEFSNNVVAKIFADLEQRVSPGTNPANKFAQSFNEILKQFIKSEKVISQYVNSIIEDGTQLSDLGFIDKSDFDEKIKKWRRLHDPQNDKFSKDKFSKEFSLDILFRIFISYYCKKYFQKKQIFTDKAFPEKINPENMQKFFDEIQNVDFSGIFNEQNLDFIPNNMNKIISKSIENFTSILNKEMENAISTNADPSFIKDRIVSEQTLFPDEVGIDEGKVMTDSRLANFVTSICHQLTKGVPEIFDVGCGTGNFLSYSYDRIHRANPKLSHNEILEHLHGSEIDNLLGKLGVFELLMKDPKNLNVDTKLDIRLNDFFEITDEDFEKYDMVLMNPPFIRPDNHRVPLNKENIEKKIKDSTGKKSFMSKSSQPNLYFYFIEMAQKILKNNGIASFILPQSFMNTDNGKTVKEFLLNNFEILYIVAIPSSFFFGRSDISPCVIILKNSSSKNEKNKIKFVRLLSSKFFDRDYKIEMDEDKVDDEIIFKTEILQNKINAKDNWREHLLPDTKYLEIIQKSDNFQKFFERGNTNNKFKSLRGQLANTGSGNAWFFPWSTKTSTGCKCFGKYFKNEIGKIEPVFKKYGLKKADVVKNYILTKEDIKSQQALIFDEKEIKKINQSPGIKKFKEKFESDKLPKDCELTLPTDWKRLNFVANPQILIPRNLRKDLYVSYNPFWNTEKIYCSTNFCMFYNCNLKIEKLDVDEILKFIAGYLNSSFIQIYMEKRGTNREGARKFDSLGPLQDIPIPIKFLDENTVEIKKIIEEFENLEFGLTGMEKPGKENARFKLDLSVANLLWKIESKFVDRYDSPKALAITAQNDLYELVSIRKETIKA